jgi:hypothetical protein
MAAPRKRPCSICRRWFRPDPRVGNRQHACGQPECQMSRRQKTQASWRRRNRDYAIAYRLDQRKAQAPPSPEPLRLPAPLNQLPWDIAKDEFGAEGADFIGVMGALIVRMAKDEIRLYLLDPTRLLSTLPAPRQKTSSGLGHTEARASDHATGVSPTRPAMGTPASPATAPAAPVDGIAG